MVSDRHSITVVMPALNEERFLEEAVSCARKRVEAVFNDWEILIFNDGSTDRTGEIAETLAASDPRIKAFHNTRPKNLGGVYRDGVHLATKDFLIMVPGDNENGGESLTKVLEAAGAADIVIPYVLNPKVRSLKRRLVSRAFVMMVNSLSGCHLRYYNGTVLHRTSLLKKYAFKTDSFGYQAEILVGLIRRGYTFSEIGVELTPKESHRSSALRLSNVLMVLKFMSSLVSARRQLRPI